MGNQPQKSEESPFKYIVGFTAVALFAAIWVKASSSPPFLSEVISWAVVSVPLIFIGLIFAALIKFLIRR